MKARNGFKLMERHDPLDVDFVHKEGQKGKGKGNDNGKGKPEGKSKGKGKQNEKGKSSGKGSSNQKKNPRYLQELWQDRTQVERMLGERRCPWTSVSCKSAHESQVFIHAESDRVVPNFNVALHVAESSPTQQSTVDHTHQPDIRSESANPVNLVILSNTAKLVVDAGCFDHC